MPAIGLGTGLGFLRNPLASFLAGASLDMNYVQGTYLGANPTDLTVSRASVGYASNSQGQWQAFAANQPRITDLGLLVEESRTNSVRNNAMVGAVVGSPGTLPTTWAPYGGPFDGINVVVAGTGTELGMDYIDLRFSGTVAAGGVVGAFAFTLNQATAAANGQTWTGSVFTKLAAGSFAGMAFLSQNLLTYASDGVTTVENLTAAGNVSMTSVLTRQSQTATLANASDNSIVQRLRFQTSGPGTVVDFTLRVAWPQLEQGAFATSPIRTTGAAATRAADVISLTGAKFSSWYTAGSSSIYVEVTPNTQSVAGRPVSLSDGTTTNVQEFYVNVGGLQIVNYQEVGGGVTLYNAATSSTGAVPGSVFRIAGASAVGDHSQSPNGVPVLTSATAGALPTLTRADIGNRADGARPFNGYIRRIAYFPSRLTNAQLEALTLADPTLDMDFANGVYSGASPAALTVSRASVGYADDARGNLILFGSGVARITPKGLLVEESRTNLLLRSQNFSVSPWSKPNATVTDNVALAPDGTMTAASLIDTTASAQHPVFQGVTIAANTLYTFSCYVKAAGRPRVKFRYLDGGFANGVTVTVDLTTGTIVQTSAQGSGTSVSSSIQAMANGWYRLTASAIVDATSTSGVCAVYLDNGSSDTYAGDGVSGVYVWGAQLEQASFATSYIPTVTATAIRAADNVTLALTTAAPISMATDVVLPNVGGPFNQIAMQVDDGTTNNRVTMLIANTTALGAIVPIVATVTQTTVTTANAASANVSAKLASAYNTSDGALTLNGNTVATAAPASAPTGMAKLSIGANVPAQGAYANGYIKRARVWNGVRVSNTNLQALTS